MRTKEPADTELATDVALYLINESEFYFRTQYLRRNYSKKVVKGIFDPAKAVRGLDEFVAVAPKMLWFKRYYADGIRLNPATRKLICEQILDHWMEELQDVAA